MAEAIKSVIWDHGDVMIGDKKVRKYLIGLILITDKPIEGVIDQKDHVAMGNMAFTNRLTDVISLLEKFRPPFVLGDLTDAMLAVSEFTPDDLEKIDQKA